MSNTYDYGAVFNPELNILRVGPWDTVKGLPESKFPKSIQFNGYDNVTSELTEEASICFMWAMFGQLCCFHKISPDLVHSEFLNIPAYHFANCVPGSTLSREAKDDILNSRDLTSREEWRSL